MQVAEKMTTETGLSKKDTYWLNSWDVESKPSFILQRMPSLSITISALTYRHLAPRDLFHHGGLLQAYILITTNSVEKGELFSPKYWMKISGLTLTDSSQWLGMRYIAGQTWLIWPTLRTAPPQTLQWSQHHLNFIGWGWWSYSAQEGNHCTLPEER